MGAQSSQSGIWGILAGRPDRRYSVVAGCVVRSERGAASLFEGVGQLQHSGLSKGGSENLQTDREFATNFAAWNRDAGHAGQRACNRIYIS